MSLLGFGAVSEKDITVGFGKAHPNQTVSTEVDKASRIFIKSKKKKKQVGCRSAWNRKPLSTSIKKCAGVTLLIGANFQ